MKFKVENYLYLNSYNEAQKACFDGFEILDVLYLIKDDEIILKIHNNSVLPHVLYEDLKAYFKDVLNHDVKLYFKCERQNLSLVDIDLYKEDFSLKNNSLFKSALPTIVNGKICFLYDDSKHYFNDETYIQEFKNYLKDIGFKDDICFDYKRTDINLEDKEIKVEIKEISKPEIKKQEKPHYNRPSKEYTKIIIDDMIDPLERVYFSGEIFKKDIIVTRNNKMIVTLYIKDENNACIAKIFESSRFDADMIKTIKEGNNYHIYGDYRLDKFSNDYLFFIDKMEEIEVNKSLKDDEVEKRIELHAHTNKSEMDGVCEAEELVKAAFEMGHEAIAITDHYVTQAFPRAQKMANSLLKANPDRKFKVLYGCEFSMIEPRLKMVYNPSDDLLSETEYVVFDLETTGLSSKYDSIIEFGAVLMHKGEVKEKKDFFIKPPCDISDFITRLTNITKEDVKNARSFKECKDEILDFIRGRVLVAHNAQFDYGFLNEELRKINEEPLTNPVIDTLDLSRSMFNRRSYNLGSLCKQYGVNYNEEVAHRADYDAEVLSQVFNLMLKKIREDGIKTVRELNDYQDKDAYIKKRPYHTNVLVKNKAGLKDLFKLVSIAHTKTIAVFNKNSSAAKEVTAEPQIYKETLNEYRENLLIGSGCLNGEIFELAQTKSQSELEEAMQFYDYIEVQPLENYRHLVLYRQNFENERLIEIVKNIIFTAIKLNKLIVATGDVHYVKKDEKILRDVYINAMAIGGAHHPLYIYNREVRQNAIMPDQHLRSTKEMLECFAFLEDEKLIKDMVIYNPKKIADMCENITPIHSKLYTPVIDGSDKILSDICYEKAYEIYGKPLDKKIEQRLKRELDAIIGNGYGVIYYVSHLLVKKSNSDGYLVGSRGSVGSSFVATMSGITEVNPLPPHYICPHCKYLEWVDEKEVASGYNLPLKKCPKCGHDLRGEGQDIPFETFLGFEGDKVPDIDLNFSGEYQDKAHLFTRSVFGDDHVFRAGTISTVAEKTAFGYVAGYYEEMGKTNISRAQKQRLASGCEGVKRTTGQHPGGIIVIPNYMDVYDFTPIQYPANDPSSAWRTTHFDFHEIHDNVLKFDILGHVDPTAMRLLQNISGVDPKTIPMNDSKVMSLFNSSKALNIQNDLYEEKTGACGLPEFGTRFVRGILELTLPSTFSELVQISGLSHGTDVWNNNAKDLIEEGILLKDVIGCRDDIMVTLINYGLPSKASFDIMEKVRKGKGLSPEHEKLMLEHEVPKWYIESCKKIKYMFPKAHAVAYVIMAVRIAWFKVYYPEYYYVSYFSLRCDAYDISIMIQDAKTIKDKMDYLQTRIFSKDPANMASKKERDLYDTLEICFEMVSRGYRLINIDIEKSLATEFLVNPDNHHEIIPPFVVLDGLGENVALSIIKAREERPFISKEDLVSRTQLSTTLLKKLEELHIIDHLDDSNQMSLF